MNTAYNAANKIKAYVKEYFKVLLRCIGKRHIKANAKGHLKANAKGHITPHVEGAVGLTLRSFCWCLSGLHAKDFFRPCEEKSPLPL